MPDEPQRIQLGAGTSATLASEYAGNGVGRPPVYGPEVVEMVLWEIAVKGGNCAAALQALKSYADDRETELQADELPSAETARRWIRGRYRNRYYEISHGRARELEERARARQIERAVRLDELEQDAMQQISGRIGGLDAVEAAKVLQAVSGAKKASVDVAMALSRNKREAEDSRSLRTIGESLARMGVASFDAVGTVAGEGEETPSLPAGSD